MTAARKHRTIEQAKEMACYIRNKFGAKNVILFGSYAYGKPDKYSDIDMLVVMKTKEKNYRKAADIKIALNHRFGLPFPMDLLVRTPAELKDKDKNDSFIREVLTMGKEL
jgi:uncharacterized protein